MEVEEYQVMDAMTLMAKFLVNVTKQNQLYLRMALQNGKVPLILKYTGIEPIGIYAKRRMV